MRRFLGFIAAIGSVPLAISIALTIVAIGRFSSFTNADWRSWIGTAVIFSIYAVPIALVVGMLVGLPVSLIMESAGFTSDGVFSRVSCAAVFPIHRRMGRTRCVVWDVGGARLLANRLAA